MRLRALVLCAVVILLASSPQRSSATAGAETDVWYSYTNGNAVRGVALDRERNVLWVASVGGVIRWNLDTGTYTKFTTLDGLIDGAVLSVAIDEATGTAWFGTEHGLSRLGGADGMWSNMLAGEYIHRIQVSHDQTAGRIWAATGHGAYHLDVNGVILEHISAADGLPEDDVLVAWQHPVTREVWFGTNHGGVRRLASGEIIAGTPPIDTDTPVFDYAYDAATGDMWVGTLAFALRLTPDGRTQLFQQWASGISRSEVWRVAVHPITGDVWFAGPAGVSILRADGKWNTLSYRDGLPASEVHDLLIDEVSGDVWMANHVDFRIAGKADGGIVRIPMQGPWQVLKTNDRIAQAQPMRVSIDPVSGDAWFGGIDVVDRRSPDDGWRHYPVALTGGYATYGIAFDPKAGDAWLAILELGLARIGAGDHIWKFVPDASRVNSRTAIGIHYDPRGDVMVASTLSRDTLYPGIMTIDRDNTVSYIEIPGVPRQMPAISIGTDAITGDLWLAFPSKGWGASFPSIGIVFQDRNGEWTSISKRNSPLPTSDILNYAADPTTGDRWFGTTMGLFRRRLDGSWERNGVPEILEAGSIGLIKLDPQRQELWVGGMANDNRPFGVYLRDADGSWHHPTGLVSDAVNDIDVDPLTGDVWFATQGGASRLHRVKRSNDCGQAVKMAPGDSVSTDLPTGDETHLYRFAVTDPYSHVEVTAMDATDALDVEVFRGCEGDIGAGRGQHIGSGRGQHIGGQQSLIFDVGSQVGPYYVAVRRKAGSQTAATTYTLHLSIGESAARDRRTLIITHLPRLQSLYGRGETDAGWRSMREVLTAFADSRMVNGILVDNLQTGTNAAVWQAYGRWLASPNDAARANAVVSALAGWVDEQRRLLPDLRYVVLIGDDRVVPHARVAIAPTDAIDPTWQSEDRYLADTDLDPASTIGSALASDFTLSDDPYVAAIPQHLRNGLDLAIPELALGRLIGEPELVASTLRRFLDSAGELTLTDSVAAGDDFMADAAETADRLLAADGLTDGHRRRLFGDWSSEDLLRSLWPDADPERDGRLTVVAAHARHDGLRAPHGFVVASDIAAAKSPNGVAIIVGCHAGLNGIAAGAGTDLPTAWLADNTTYIAPTGWAYGTQEFLGYQESLTAEILRRLAGGGAIAVGEALVDAKRAYFLSHDTNHLHAKTIAGTTLFGLPMWVVRSPAGVAAAHETLLTDRFGRVEVSSGKSSGGSAFVRHAVAAPQGLSRLAGGHDLWIKPDSRYPLSEGLSRVDDAAAGSYFTYPGNQPVAEIGRTVQPAFNAEFGSVTRDGQRLSPRGIVITRASMQVLSDFAPRIANGGALSAITGMSRRQLAPTVSSNAPSSPSSPALLRRLERGSRSGVTESRGRANLVIRVGAFDAVRREERLMDDIVLDEYYGGSADRTGPDVTSVTTATLAGNIRVDVGVSDPSNILRVVVAYTSGAAWTSVDLANGNPERTHWSGVVPLESGGVYLVQVVDGAGNVTTIDEAGRMERPLAEDEALPTPRQTLYMPYSWNER